MASGLSLRHSLRSAMVVAPIVSPIAPVVSIPAMVVIDVAARAFPAAGKIPTIHVVWRDPVRSFIWRSRPVAVVPDVMVSLRVVVALDPDIVGPRLGRHAVRAWRRRLADANAE